MGREYPSPLGMGMRFNFSSPLNLGRVTGKYMGVGDGDGEGKTRPHPAPLACLMLKLILYTSISKRVLMIQCIF